MKNFKKALVLSVTFATTIGFCNFANANEKFSVAIVNVPVVVESSSEVMALRKEQQLKLDELQAWLNIVRADVEKQSTKEGKEKLIKKYDAEFAKKQQAIKANYEKKLQIIETNITEVIEQERKAKGYDLVLTKDTVLSGGVDITKEIAKKIK